MGRGSSTSDDVDPFIERLRSDRGRRVIYVHVEHPCEVEWGPYVSELPIPHRLIRYLESIGIKRLFKHQWISYNYVLEGHDVVIVSGTGTGKTESFIIPLIKLLSESIDHAMIVYPTKALARDQLLRIRSYLDCADLDVEVYDGDTPSDVRRRIYERAPRVIITNPDMISQALTYVSKFREIVRKVRYMVLDDFHVYSGALGVGVHYVLNRMRRICRSVQYIATTATIGNPEEFARQILGRDVKVVRGVSGRRGLVKHVLVKPTSRSKIVETADLIRLCIEQGKRCLAFADSHRLVEYVKRVLDRWGFGDQIMVHRAGLRPEVRREIEDRFRDGSLKALIATPTLEMGIDIGDVDVAIMSTIPPSYMKYLQRSGRVGRRGQTSYVIQVLGSDPISSYFERRPEEFYSREVEPLYVDVTNEDIARYHLLAMSLEKPMRLSELSGFERHVVDKLAQSKLVEIRGGYVRITRDGLRALRSAKGIRGAGDQVRIVHEGKLIGFRELPIAIRELHDEAIYLHGGEVYRVVSLDLSLRTAYVVKYQSERDYVTTPLYRSDPSVVRVLESGEVSNVPYDYVELKIREAVYGYVLRELLSGETVEERLFDRPILYEFSTKGIILYFPQIKLSNVELIDLVERAKAYHALEHALIISSQISVGSGQTDLGGISYPTGHIVIYDSFIGGSGLSRQLVRRFKEVLRVAHNVLSQCTCADGCPRCIYSVYCGNNNRYLSRRNALRVLDRVLKGEAALRTEIPLEVESYV